MKKKMLFKRETKLTRAEYKKLNQLVPLVQTKADWLLLVSLVAHQEFIWKVRTTEVSAVLGITRSKAYGLLCEAEKAGVLVGYQMSDDYAEEAPRITTKRFNRQACVWEIWIKGVKDPNQSGDLHGCSDLGLLIPAMKRKFARYLKKKQPKSKV